MKFRKKPIEVEAIKFVYTEFGLADLEEFCGPVLGNIKKARHPSALAEAEIGTLEDGVHLTVKHIATEGDYIIKGIAGEFYPCKPDIFEATYDPVK
jgi:hypothetical protein